MDNHGFSRFSTISGNLAIKAIMDQDRFIYGPILYDRRMSSKTAKRSQCRIKVSMFDAANIPIHSENRECIKRVLDCIFKWDSDDWSE